MMRAKMEKAILDTEMTVVRNEFERGENSPSRVLTERVMATRENIVYGAKSTEFMAPPNYGFKLLREAALRLATEDSAVGALLNPRQSTPVEYVGSALNLPAQPGRAVDAACLLRAGMPAPEAKLRGPGGDVHLTSCFGSSFVLLYFAETALPADLAALATQGDSSPAGVRVIRIARQGPLGFNTLVDETTQAHERYGAAPGSTFLVRPDGYLMGCWEMADTGALKEALKSFQQTVDAARCPA